MTTPRDFLDSLYEQSLDTNIETVLTETQFESIDIVVKNVEKQKAVLTVLITSLLKKIDTPTQDIRQHKKELVGGYSGRSYDTHFVTPFLQAQFPRYAMAESGWLTRSLEQVHAFTIDFPGKIANKDVKTAFLAILHDVEINKANSKNYLIATLRLLTLFQKQQTLRVITPVFQGTTVLDIVSMLEEHFFASYRGAGASRLPVLALHTLYEQLLTSSRYRNKTLAPLKRHTTSDVRATSFGDIEILNEDGTCYEAIEVKHGKPITPDLINLTYETKLSTSSINRYYLLSTHVPDVEDKIQVAETIRQIRQKHGCEVIANGILPSLKYYLRLIENPDVFLSRYTQALEHDYASGTDIKQVHVEKWIDILSGL